MQICTIRTENCCFSCVSLHFWRSIVAKSLSITAISVWFSGCFSLHAPFFFRRLPPPATSFSSLPTRSGTAGTPQLVFGLKQVHLPQEAFIIGSIHKMIHPAVFSVIHVQFRQNSCPQLLFFAVSLFLMLLLFRSYALPGTCLDISFRLVSQSGRPRIVQLVENHP